MSNPIVSVLVPVYNVEDYLEKCLDSILNQTLSEIEIVCVNDGSTDNSGRILDAYAQKDSRIVIITKENGGLPSARNAGLDHAKGEYVGFVDSDDYIQPEMFEKLVKTARRKKSEVVICGANIYPEKPQAEQWLYNTLSPSYRHYKTFEPRMLYERSDTTPYLWRVLAKRSLIEREHFRLDEDIIIGEDKAFQCKLYSRANGITIIPDKLYNYCWYRPGSLMSNLGHGKVDNKVEAHARLIASIFLDWQQIDMDKELRSETERAFLTWSIPFIYDDFIYTSTSAKVSVAACVVTVWKQAGFYRQKHRLSKWIQDAFDYIARFEKLSVPVKEPELSVIAYFDSNVQYVDEWLENIDRIFHIETTEKEELCHSNVFQEGTVVESQNDSFKNRSLEKADLFKEEEPNKIEIIVLNNGMKEWQYWKILRLLNRNPCIRCYNTSKHFSYGETLNHGIDLAVGEYICFQDVQDWYASEDQLKIWLKYAQAKKSDLCTSDYCRKRLPHDRGECILIGENSIREDLIDLDFHDVLYRRQFLMDEKMVFPDASILTGFIFYYNALYRAKKIHNFPGSVYIQRETHCPEWISASKCEKVLQALEELEDLSLEKGNAALHAKVFSLLNGNVLKRLIINSTKPNGTKPGQRPDVEKSQSNSLLTVFSILSKADIRLLKEAGYTDEDSILDIAHEMVLGRLSFLETF